MHMFECSQKSSDNLPTPTPHPAPHHWAVLFSRLAASPYSQDTRDLIAFKKNKRLLGVCIPYNHFIRVTRVFSIQWKSHKTILYLTSVTTDHSRITVGFSFGAEIEIVSSIQSYSEFL